MIRLSAMRNCPVICGNKRLGFLQNMRLDLERKKVSALIVSCGIRGKKLVSCNEIESITDEYILVRKIQRFDRMGNDEKALFARDTTGLLLGRVSDYALDQNKMRVIAVEILLGYLPKEFRSGVWIYSFKYKKDLIIPSQVGCELMNMEQED